MVKRMPHTQRSTISGINMSTYIKRKRSASTLPHRLAADCNFPSLSHSKCLSVWLIVSLCFYLAVFPTPRWSSVSSSLSLSLSLSIHFSFTMNITTSVPWGAPSKKLHTLCFDTNVLEHLSHLSGSVVNIRSHPSSPGGGGAGCMWVCARVHLTHITHRLPNI